MNQEKLRLAIEEYITGRSRSVTDSQIPFATAYSLNQVEIAVLWVLERDDRFMLGTPTETRLNNRKWWKFWKKEEEV
jgi:hypothetical protein